MLRSSLLLIFFLVLSGCEKAIIDDDGGKAGQETDDEAGHDAGHDVKEDYNLFLTVATIDSIPLAEIMKGGTPITCSRLSFAIYDMDGSRVSRAIHQQVADDGFGMSAFTLSEGQYQIVAVAHSSDRNPTMSDPTAIKFSNDQGFTPTYLHSSVVTVGKKSQTLALSLHGISSCCRIVRTSDLPPEASRVRFFYTGGSGAFNASTGRGSVKSSQSVFFPADASCRQYDLYTILPREEASLNVLVTVYNARNHVLTEKELDIPLRHRETSVYETDFSD